MLVAIADIVPDPDQPRKTFNEASLRSLADSFGQNGPVQPIVVRPVASGKFQIIVGERRWRAAQLLGLQSIDVQVQSVPDKEARRMQLVENLQRDKVPPVEQARAWKAYREEHHLSQEALAKEIGTTQSTISNYEALLNLGDLLVNYLEQGTLLPTQGFRLASIKDRDRQHETASWLMRESIWQTGYVNEICQQVNNFPSVPVSEIVSNVLGGRKTSGEKKERKLTMDEKKALKIVHGLLDGLVQSVANRNCGSALVEVKVLGKKCQKVMDAVEKAATEPHRDKVALSGPMDNPLPLANPEFQEVAGLMGDDVPETG